MSRLSDLRKYGEIRVFQNIEVIFTQEQLEEFVNQGILERLEFMGEITYVKKGCRISGVPSSNKSKESKE